MAPSSLGTAPLRPKTRGTPTTKGYSKAALKPRSKPGVNALAPSAMGKMTRYVPIDASASMNLNDVRVRKPTSAMKRAGGSERKLPSLSGRRSPALESASKTQNLSALGLHEVPSFIYEQAAGSITALNLSHNDLTSLPEALSSLSKLQCVSLEHNRLMRLPAAIISMKSLVALQCASNLLTGDC